jgi:hypothetical protein
MSQSTVVVGAVLAAFVAWLAINQRLGVYLSIVGV